MRYLALNLANMRASTFSARHLRPHTSTRGRAARTEDENKETGLMLVDLGGKRLPQGHRVIGGPLGHKQPGMVAGHDVAVVDAVGQELGEEVGQGQRLLGRTGRRIFITLQTGRPTTPQPTALHAAKHRGYGSAFRVAQPTTTRLPLTV